MAYIIGMYTLFFTLSELSQFLSCRQSNISKLGQSSFCIGTIFDPTPDYFLRADTSQYWCGRRYPRLVGWGAPRTWVRFHLRESGKKKYRLILSMSSDFINIINLNDCNWHCLIFHIRSHQDILLTQNCWGTKAVPI